MTSTVSIIIPARDEARNLARILPELRAAQPDAEILVVDDGSTDDTRDVCVAHGVRVISHRYGMGNGAAVKTGARNASGEALVFMDADGQHRPADIARLAAEFDRGFDMVVGARTPGSQANRRRRFANALYSRLASWMVGHRIRDLTSGFRIVDAERFREFLSLLPNGFSYPTTITMAFFRSGYPVGYVDIDAGVRAGAGRSHIRYLRDGLRFFLIIFRIGTLYSPLRLFLPVSLAFFTAGFGYYLFTFLSSGRFTNMSALLLSTSVLVFLIGLVSEQITSLLYNKRPE